MLRSQHGPTTDTSIASSMSVQRLLYSENTISEVNDNLTKTSGLDARRRLRIPFRLAPSLPHISTLATRFDRAQPCIASSKTSSTVYRTLGNQREPSDDPRCPVCPLFLRQSARCVERRPVAHLPGEGRARKVDSRQHLQGCGHFRRQHDLAAGASRHSCRMLSANNSTSCWRKRQIASVRARTVMPVRPELPMAPARTPARSHGGTLSSVYLPGSRIG